MALKKEEVLDTIRLVIERRNRKQNVKDWLISQNWTPTEAHQIVQWSKEGDVSISDLSEETPDNNDTGNLVFHDQKYVYNKESDTFIIPLKCCPKPLIMTGEQHRAICRNYSNWIGEGLSINEIARKFKMPRSYFNEYKEIFQLTHDREPLTVEELMDKSIPECLETILEEKRFALHQEYEKAQWKRTQDEAEKWRAFEGKQLDPLKSFLHTWVPPKLEPIQTLDTKPDAQGDIFLVGLSDLHFGSEANPRYLFGAKGFDTQITCNRIYSYANQIHGTVLNRKQGFSKAVICIIGDILHGLRGRTEKGTVLEADKLRDEQLDYAFTSLSTFIQRMRAIFGTVEVHSVRGNHDGVDNYALIMAVAAYFRTEPNIVFNNYSTRTAIFRAKDVLCMIDHGASDMYKANVPNGKSRETYIQSLLLANPQQLIGVKQKIFMQGHLHHYENIEYGEFEFVMFGSTATSDRHANANNWRARARQNALVISNDGVSERLSYYLDHVNL